MINDLNLPDEAIKNLHPDSIDFGRTRAKAISQRKLNGTFKLSEKQFVDEAAYIWLSGNMSAAEILLRKVDMDPTMTRSDMQAELHLYILQCVRGIKKQVPQIKLNVELEDLIVGNFSTEKYLAARNLKLPKHRRPPEDEEQIEMQLN